MSFILIFIIVELRCIGLIRDKESSAIVVSKVSRMKVSRFPLLLVRMLFDPAPQLEAQVVFVKKSLSN